MTAQDIDISDNALCASGCIVLSTVLDKITYLQRLNISGNILTSAGADIFLRILPRTTPHLTALVLEQNQLCAKAIDPIVSYLAKCTRLERLSLSRNDLGPGTHAHFWRTIGAHPRLNYLSAERCGLTEPAADAIADALACNTMLRILALGGNTLRMYGVFTVLTAVVRHNETLLKLSLNENQADFEDGVVHLSTPDVNTTLQTLSLCNNLVCLERGGIANDLLVHLRGLRTLMLKNCLLHDGCAQGLGDVLASCATLEKLYIGGNIFGMYGLAHVFGYVKDHPRLVMLAAQQNWNGNMGRARAVAALCRLITNAASLRSIRMHSSMLLCADSDEDDLRVVLAAMYARAACQHTVNLTGVDLCDLWRRKALPDIYGLANKGPGVLCDYMLELAHRETAVLMAQHARLGARSWLHVLDEGTMHVICREFGGAL